VKDGERKVESGKRKRGKQYRKKEKASVEKLEIREDRGVFPAYRRLKVWEKAHENLLAILKLLEIVSSGPVTDRIKDQLIGSASSIGANIAEGSGIYKGKRFVGHLEIALDSACETDNWLQVLKDSVILNKSIDNALLTQIIERNCEVIKMLLGLIQSIEKKRASAL
jgi:four helix bundle protein